MALDERILFQLGVKGVPPDQIDAAARQTGDQLYRSMRVQYERLRKAHQEMLDAQGKDAVKTADLRIKQEERVLAAMEKIRRAAEIQANKDANPFSGVQGMLQGAKNVLHIGQMIGTAVTGAVHAFEQLSAEIIRTTQVYGALKGSIDDAKAATGGEVSNLDLIIAKNRAVQLEMNLTDKQFAVIAESAKGFADAVGTDTADALSQLVTGIGTAREKTLKLMGVFVDAKQVYEDMAEARGVAVDELTEEEKRTGFQTEALRLLELRLETVVEKADTFANQLERVGTGLKNAKTETQNAIGGSTGLASVLSAMGDAMTHVMAVTLPGGEQIAVSIELEEQARAFVKLNRDAMAAARAINAAAAAQRAYGLAAYGGELAEGGQDVGTPFLGKQFQGRGAMKGGARKGGARKKDDSREFLDNLLFGESGGASGTNRKALSGTDALYDYSTSQEDLAGLADSAMQGFTDSFGAQIELLQRTASDRLQAAGLDKGGIMAGVLFGPEGAEGWETLIADTSDQTLQMLGMISEAGMAMAAAVGDSLAALTAGDETHFAKQARAILKNLSSIAYTKALMETAEGIAMLAIGSPTAAIHFKAAAAFAAVGLGAGLTARSVNDGGGGGGSGGVPTSRRGSEFGGNGGGRGGGGGSESVVINIGSIYPGGEAEAGRQIQKALDAYQAKTGRLRN